MSKLTHEQWLAERRKSIGGSDAAAIVGMNHYVTPYMLWADKTGRLPDKPDNEAMRQGRDLEQYVADECAATRQCSAARSIRSPMRISTVRLSGSVPGLNARLPAS